MLVNLTPHLTIPLTLRKKPHVHMFGKKKTLVTSIFFFSQNIFLHSQNKFHFFQTIILSSANAFSLDQIKICCLVKSETIMIVGQKHEKTVELEPAIKKAAAMSIENFLSC